MTNANGAATKIVRKYARICNPLKRVNPVLAGKSSDAYWIAADRALGNTSSDRGTSRSHWPPANSNTKKITPLTSHNRSKLKCHQRARPTEWRNPGIPSHLGNATESSFAVHTWVASAGSWRSAGTGPRMRNHSRPGLLPESRLRRGWSARICNPARMMNIMNNRLKKCCQRSHHGNPPSTSGT